MNIRKEDKKLDKVKIFLFSVNNLSWAPFTRIPRRNFLIHIVNGVLNGKKHLRNLL